MKQILSIALSAILFLSSCSKKDDAEPKEETPQAVEGTFLLSNITIGSGSIFSLTYNGKVINKTDFSIFYDEIYTSSVGRIDSSRTYLKSNNTIYRINKVYYGSNGKIEKIEHRSGTAPFGIQEQSNYTYDSSGRVKTITIGTRMTVTYQYNSAGNVTSFTRETRAGGSVKTEKITNTTFDDKKNPFTELSNFEYFLSSDYQTEYGRLGAPIYPSKNNETAGTGEVIYDGVSNKGSTAYKWTYNSNGYPTANSYRYTKSDGVLNGDYGFNYIVIK